LKSEVIGAVTISTSHLANGQPEEKDHQLTFEPKNKTNNKGSIRLKLHFPKSKTSISIAESNKSKVITDLYIIGEEIGRGGFSIVKKGVNKQTKENVAVKIIEKKNNRTRRSCIITS